MCTGNRLTEEQKNRWNEICNDDLDLLLFHSDCDGKFAPQECRRIYNAIKDLHMDMQGHNYTVMKQYNMLEHWKNIFLHCAKRRVTLRYYWVSRRLSRYVTPRRDGEYMGACSKVARRSPKPFVVGSIPNRPCQMPDSDRINWAYAQHLRGIDNGRWKLQKWNLRITMLLAWMKKFRIDRFRKAE